MQCTEKVLWPIRRVKSGLRRSLVLLTLWPKALYCGAVLCTGGPSAAPLASPHWKPIVGDSGRTQNTQTNEVAGENEKRVFYFTEENHMDFWIFGSSAVGHCKSLYPNTQG